MNTIIETKELVKHYNGAPEPAVRGVSFAVREGEIFSLLGPNGAGKTTIISMLSCLLTPTSGDAIVAGNSIIHDPMEVKKVIGVVPQEIALYPKLSARENLVFWGRMYGMGGRELKRRIDEVLEIAGLKERAKDRIETYSGGMQRRINIAVGLLHHPQLVFMDEPTVGIDPQSRRNILDTVKALNQQGMTVLYTTHYMEEAQELSHRIGIIDRGHMIALGTFDELTQLIEREDVVELTITEESSTLELLDALSKVDGVRNVNAENGKVSLLAFDGNAVLPDLISVANAQHVRVSNVMIREPNLEAVFLHLTGRALRD
ncbi:MAG: ATP-binding cassette domain-containing protein [Anaerolineales bacterium]|nr:MAG: ATP-binding cassette domain-containing protein [Anaerolineales bacterium]